MRTKKRREWIRKFDSIFLLTILASLTKRAFVTEAPEITQDLRTSPISNEEGSATSGFSSLFEDKANLTRFVSLSTFAATRGTEAEATERPSSTISFTQGGSTETNLKSSFDQERKNAAGKEVSLDSGGPSIGSAPDSKSKLEVIPNLNVEPATLSSGWTTERALQRATEQTTEQLTERATEPTTEQLTERATEPTTEQLTERATEEATIVDSTEGSSQATIVTTGKENVRPWTIDKEDTEGVISVTGGDGFSQSVTWPFTVKGSSSSKASPYSHSSGTHPYTSFGSPSSISSIFRSTSVTFSFTQPSTTPTVSAGSISNSKYSFVSSSGTFPFSKTSESVTTPTTNSSTIQTTTKNTTTTKNQRRKPKTIYCVCEGEDLWRRLMESDQVFRVFDKNRKPFFQSCDKAKKERGYIPCRGKCFKIKFRSRRWRPDMKCDPEDQSGSFECNPQGLFPCCSAHGWCGDSESHCSCKGCKDYRKEGNVVRGCLRNPVARRKRAECTIDGQWNEHCFCSQSACNSGMKLRAWQPVFFLFMFLFFKSI